MKFAKVSIYLIIFILINSCALNKAAKYLKEGKTEQENFTNSISFELEKGWIIVPVEIENKIYRFILDTGTPTLVSKELARSLKMKAIDSVDAYDVYNNVQKNKYTRIENIKIGKTDFVGTAALINDFNATPIWASLNVDGFIGSNLMQHAIWDIDFKQKQVTITDNESNLNLPEDLIENKMFIGVAGLPSIACKINGERIWNFPVDLGYNGGIVMPFSEFEKQIENGQISDFKKSDTQGIIGVYGKQNSSRESYTGIIEEIEFGKSTLKNEKVYSEQYLSKIFGLDFFKNYRVILNWNSKKVKLIENKENTNS
ncbi:Aspartyl protease [Gillisia sp. Hel1_33_143]|uniref:retropepsin-like aspartic protease n=1 Tax=Gillisia sp. Hel1_33_143 TaxID=1336796 RepID=UPI00087CE7E4|nr:retropepsin-like aspartic protease [Gillisia sp. Hel1_33_143]SDS67029.1 Aspartyl protease [Gillisia sp. Hel1_33_143]